MRWYNFGHQFVLDRMLSINKKKLVMGLSRKKQRLAQGLFLAEGLKLVRDLIGGGVQPLFVFNTDDLLLSEDDHKVFAGVEMVVGTQEEMKQVSQLATPSSVLAVLRIPEGGFDLEQKPEGLVLVLDDIQDPGNMGTIIRVADWFGIRQIVCSNSCVDAFNPKVVQATMGALARVAVCETDLNVYLLRNQSEWQLPVYGTFLDGANIYSQPLSQEGFVVMGNEGKGISAAIGRFVTNKLLIPSYPAGVNTSESLNVSTATAIVCSEFRRRALMP